MKIITGILTLIVLISQTAFANPVEKGLASYYDDSYHGRKTANGEKYDKNKLTGAHKTLPFGTRVSVYNPANKKSVEIVINDRGPYVKGRVIELSRRAAQEINLIKAGIAQVEITIIKGKNSKKTTIAKNSSASPQKTKNSKTSLKKEAENMIVKAQKMETGGLYKMQVLKMESKGFGVQVAGYSDYESVVQQLAVIQNNWFKGATVFVDEKDGKPYYKIILGLMNTKEEAVSYCANIKEKYKIKDAFVVDMVALAKKK
jgi:rare lipoprotein A